LIAPKIGPLAPILADSFSLVKQKNSIEQTFLIGFFSKISLALGAKMADKGAWKRNKETRK